MKQLTLIFQTEVIRPPNMDAYISESSALLFSEYVMEDHFLTKYFFVSMDGADKVIKKEGKYIVTKETVVELIRHTL